MRPNGPALAHPAAARLLQVADEGPPIGISLDYPVELLDSAVRRGAHPTAQQLDAARALRLETLEKVQHGFAQIIPWQRLRKKLPQRLKISPIAAIPHKSRQYRMILDLSFAFADDGHRWPSVNAATDRSVAPLQAMTQLGKVLPRLIHALATLPETKGPILLMKADIKDGFWRITVPEAEEYNFAYVLPQLPEDATDDPYVVIPSALQMGWTNSPPEFCAATETARDVAESLRTLPSLPMHPLECKTINQHELFTALKHPHAWSPDTLQDRLQNLNYLFEVYVDDFIGLIQATDEGILRHHTRALFHAIHSVFPPASVTGHSGGDPISEKKLEEGEGIWAARKEILGWLFDGIARTIELPPKKVTKIEETITRILRTKSCTNTELQSLLGKLQHASLGIPGGRGLLCPLYKKLDTHTHTIRKHVSIPRDSHEYRLLYDFRALIHLVGSRPTHCAQLIAGIPSYIGFCDACKYGAGGVWFAGSKYLDPIVWRLEWPEDIPGQLISSANPKGTLTINDLELAALLLHYLVLEQLVDLKHQHAAAWVDNKSTVAWATKLASNRSKVAQRLIRALSLRHCANESSPLAALSIMGIRNRMADVASRSFRKSGKSIYSLTNCAFLLKFNSDFPLTQDASWALFQLADKVNSLVFSELRMQPAPMGSWIRLTKRGHAIGTIGADSCTTMEWNPICKTSPKTSASSSSAPLLQESVQELTGAGIMSALDRCKRRFAPSARPSNWLDNAIPLTATKRQVPTGSNFPDR